MFQFFLAVYSARRTGSYYIKMLFLVINPMCGGCWHSPNLLFPLVNSYLMACTDLLYSSPVESTRSLTLGPDEVSFPFFLFCFILLILFMIQKITLAEAIAVQQNLDYSFWGASLSRFVHSA